ncbi:MAG: TlyA family RNA methyltransferase [Dehalococcoidia bacterium]
MAKGKRRLDTLLVQRELAESRERAQALIMAGAVFVAGQRVSKAGTPVPETAEIQVRGQLPYVSRGGVKLAHALDVFGVQVAGSVALDVGASTGGFTDCLLQRGASQVYALDVGHGQLASRLRRDPRVVVLEGVNARHPFQLPELVDLATVDVSFISLTLVLPQVARHVKPGGPVIALVKPQFEARRREVGRGGVIKDPSIHAAVLARVLVWAVQHGFRLRNLTPSPIRGDKGNREFFILTEVRAAAH